MEGARGLCNFLRERETRIIQPTLINKINSAIRPNGPGHRGDFVDNEPQYLVAAAQFLRGSGSLNAVEPKNSIGPWRLERQTLFKVVRSMTYIGSSLKTRVAASRVVDTCLPTW